MTRNEAVEILKTDGCYECYVEADNPYVCNDGSCEIREAYYIAIEALERPHGEWIERNVTQDRRDAKIPEWQSAKCSVCGKYHTTPYMYYFKKYNYCPFCGARMDERREDG